MHLKVHTVDMEVKQYKYYTYNVKLTDGILINHGKKKILGPQSLQLVKISIITIIDITYGVLPVNLALYWTLYLGFIMEASVVAQR